MTIIRHVFIINVFYCNLMLMVIRLMFIENILLLDSTLDAL